MSKSDPDWGETTFGFDLMPADNGSTISFFHTGWPACNPHYKRSSYCWAILLNGQKKYVEKKIIVPFKERE